MGIHEYTPRSSLRLRPSIAMSIHEQDICSMEYVLQLRQNAFFILFIIGGSDRFVRNEVSLRRVSLCILPQNS